MKSTTRILIAGGLAATLLFVIVTGARAAVINWTVAGVTSAGVLDPDPIFVVQTPDPGFPIPIAVDVRSSGDGLPGPDTTATAALTLASNAPGTEIAEGSASATIDPVLFNNSSVGSRSRVSTGDTVFPDACSLCMFDFSIGGLSAMLSNPLGGGATVDLMLHVGGSLILQDPGGTAGVSQVCDGDPADPFTICEIVSDMAASVSVILALADVSPLEFLDPANLPYLPLFNASATLELQEVDGIMTPVLVGEGDWASAIPGDGVFTPVGACDRFFCQIGVDFSMEFVDVQSLGFGDLFEVGLLLMTSADGTSAAGRVIDSNFGDTAFVNVAFAPQQVPTPATLLLLAAGLLGMAAARRRRRLH